MYSLENMSFNQDSFQKKQTKIYLFSYFYDNSHWTVEINAYNMEDAFERMKLLPFAKYDGELQLKIDVPSNN